MKETEVLRILGKADQIKINEENDNKVIWIFNEEKMRLTFYKSEEGKLGYIETANPKITHNSIPLIGTNIHIAKEEVFGKIHNWEVDDYHSFLTYFNEENWITLHVEYEEIKDIELGIPFNSNGNYDWRTES